MLDLNPGLAAFGPILPCGSGILLPETATIADRLPSLSVTDEDGEPADRLEIERDDREGRIALPEIDTELAVSLGFAERGLTPMGTFGVEGQTSFGIGGWPATACTIARVSLKPLIPEEEL
ncbi:MAG: hypothetical protein Kow0013_23320 [Pararhodobacter sp.]